MRKLTKEEFVSKARFVWGDKYDYSKVEYNGSKSEVKVYCKIHGFFEITPNDLLSGHGCYYCGLDKKKKIIQGVGVNDTYTPRGDDCKRIWSAMMARCYSQKNLKRNPTYRGVSVCVEWRTLSVFSSWFSKNYKKGYNLDKDLIEKGNKVYCPEKCCFVPQEINKLITRCELRRGPYPIGVCMVRKTGKYFAHVNIAGKQKHIGIFNSPEEAFSAYKKAKEEYIKEVAQDYFAKGLITERVRDALMRYEVEITD